MICYYCGSPACAKIGSSRGSIWKALLGKKCWQKSEVYVCRECFLVRKQEAVNKC